MPWVVPVCMHAQLCMLEGGRVTMFVLASLLCYKPAVLLCTRTYTPAAEQTQQLHALMHHWLEWWRLAQICTRLARVQACQAIAQLHS